MNAGLGLFGTMFILECYLTNVLSQSFDTYFCFLCTLGCIIFMYFSRVSKKYTAGKFILILSQLI